MVSQNINMIVAYIDIFIIIATITLILTELVDKKDKRMLSFEGIITMKYPAFMIVLYTLMTITSSLANGNQYFSYIIVGLSILPLLLLLSLRPYT